MHYHLYALAALSVAGARLEAAHYEVPLPRGTTEIVVATGDSITIDVRATGTAVTRWNCGALFAPFRVHACQRLAYTFAAPGAYELDVVDRHGDVVAHGLARVVGVGMPAHIAAELGFRRVLRIPVDSSGAPVRFSSSDPALLAVETVDFFVPTMSVDGRTLFTVPGSALDPDGVWTAEFSLSPNTDKSCHRLIVDQPETP